MIKVTMVLARGPADPQGNLDDRMQMLVQLTPQGLLDTAAWQTGEAIWRTLRERPGRPQRQGELVKLEEGWAIRTLEREDDPLIAIATSIVRPGEIATVTRLDGEALAYRVVAVEPA